MDRETFPGRNISAACDRPAWRMSFAPAKSSAILFQWRGRYSESWCKTWRGGFFDVVNWRRDALGSVFFRNLGQAQPAGFDQDGVGDGLFGIEAAGAVSPFAVFQHLLEDIDLHGVGAQG